MKQKNIKSIPSFKSEDEERDFWAVNSPLDFPSDFKRIDLDLSELKRSTRSITLRMPESLFSQIKIAANKRDVPYQSLMKVFLSEKVKEDQNVPSHT
jgi:predicted DNA binding CopG/RHH family protein